MDKDITDSEREFYGPQFLSDKAVRKELTQMQKIFDASSKALYQKHMDRMFYTYVMNKRQEKKDGEIESNSGDREGGENSVLRGDLSAE